MLRLNRRNRNRNMKNKHSKTLEKNIQEKSKYEENINENYNQGITTYYEPTYLPEGYVESEVQKGIYTQKIEYTNNEGYLFSVF